MVSHNKSIPTIFIALFSIYRVRAVMFNATFNNISAISWRLESNE